jgi:hypothetical protein
MNLDVYIAKLEEIRKEHGGKLICIANSKHDNGHEQVDFDPTCGWNTPRYGYYQRVSGELVNAVCVN